MLKSNSFAISKYLMLTHVKTLYYQNWLKNGPDSCIMYSDKQIKIINSVELESADFFNKKHFFPGLFEEIFTNEG